MLTKRCSDHGSRLLALPGELRMNIYSALFTHDEPIEIKRSSISLFCERDQQWFTIDGRGDSHGGRPHRECRSQIHERTTSDIYLGSGVRTHSEHYPCPRPIAACNLDLDLLLTCRQIYWETRKLPYALNTFLTKELGIFSNFTYSLNSSQVRAIKHLAFIIPETQGMTKYLAEWNDIFSLVAASFSSLETISVEVQLYDPLSACWSSFWDGGLVELDRLQLKGVKFTILDEEMQPYFTYSANPSQQKPTPFHDCRDRLRLNHGYNQNNEEDLRLFFRYSPNPGPLYVRNLIHLLPRRDRSHSMIRHEDLLQREYPTYENKFDFSDMKKRAIFGYQFNAATTSKAEIEENIRKLHLSRERLTRKLASKEAQSRPHRSQPYHTIPDGETQLKTRPVNSTRVNSEPPGQWRRLLNEETFAPFFESFPPEIPGNFPGFVFNPGQHKLACTGCADFVHISNCFLHS